MEAIGLLLMFVGCIGSSICGLWLLWIALNESVIQLLLFLFIPFYGLFYVITRWEECKTPFLYQLGCAAVAVIGMMLS